MKLTSENWYWDSTDGKAAYCWGERLVPVTAANVSTKGIKPFERDHEAEPKQQGFGAGLTPDQYRWHNELKLKEDVLPYDEWVRLYSYIVGSDRVGRVPIANLTVALVQGEDGTALQASSCYVSLTRNGTWTSLPVGVEVVKGGAPVPLSNIRIL